MAKASDNQFPYLHLVPAAAPANPSAGERLYLDSADGNRLKRRTTGGTVTPIEGSLPTCAVYRSAALNALTGVVTLIDFDAEDVDTNTFHDLVTNPSRITIPSGQGGTYSISGQISYTSNGASPASECSALVYKNGSIIAGSSYPIVGGLNAPQSVPVPAFEVPLVATDYLDLRFYHNSGATIALLVGSARRYTRFSIKRTA